MAYTDTFSGELEIRFNGTLVTTDGSIEGEKTISHKILKKVSEGAGSNQAVGGYSEIITVTTGGITLSLADSADPASTAGDDIPTSDPEGLKLKGILFENQDATNFVSVKKGTNGETSIFTGATDSVKITAGGLFLWYSPAGVSAMNDGADDELLITADTASCSVKLTYIFG